MGNIIDTKLVMDIKFVQSGITFKVCGDDAYLTQEAEIYEPAKGLKWHELTTKDAKFSVFIYNRNLPENIQHKLNDFMEVLLKNQRSNAEIITIEGEGISINPSKLYFDLTNGSRQYNYPRDVGVTDTIEWASYLSKIKIAALDIDENIAPNKHDFERIDKSKPVLLLFRESSYAAQNKYEYDSKASHLERLTVNKIANFEKTGTQSMIKHAKTVYGEHNVVFIDNIDNKIFNQNHSFNAAMRFAEDWDTYIGDDTKLDMATIGHNDKNIMLVDLIMHSKSLKAENTQLLVSSCHAPSYLSQFFEQTILLAPDNQLSVAIPNIYGDMTVAHFNRGLEVMHADLPLKEAQQRMNAFNIVFSNFINGF